MEKLQVYNVQSNLCASNTLLMGAYIWRPYKRSGLFKKYITYSNLPEVDWPDPQISLTYAHVLWPLWGSMRVKWYGRAEITHIMCQEPHACLDRYSTITSLFDSVWSTANLLNIQFTSWKYFCSDMWSFISEWKYCKEKIKLQIN